MSLVLKRTAPGLVTKRCTVQIKAADLSEDGTFSGYGNVFNVIDTVGDIVKPGAFTKSLNERRAAGDFPRMLLEHDPSQPLGIWDDITDNGHGLLCKGRLLLDVQRARETYALLKAGYPYGLSIGFETLADSWTPISEVDDKAIPVGPSMGYGLPSSHVRNVDEGDLWEVSVVSFPANKQSKVEAVKAKPQSAEFSAVDRALARRAAALRRFS